MKLKSGRVCHHKHHKLEDHSRPAEANKDLADDLNLFYCNSHLPPTLSVFLFWEIKSGTLVSQSELDVLRESLYNDVILDTTQHSWFLY